MLAEMTSEQFTEWVSFYSVDGFHDERIEAYLAQCAWASVAPHVKGKPKVSDFLLDFDRDEGKKPDVDAKLRAIAKRFEGMG